MNEMLVFLVATYNEEAEIIDLLHSVSEVCNRVVVSDDGSTDTTLALAKEQAHKDGRIIHTILNEHTGLPETIKRKGVEFISQFYGPETWVLMLDADERISKEHLLAIRKFINHTNVPFSHVWFNLIEYMDGQQARGFLKCRLFRAGSAKFSDSVHEDDRFDGLGVNFNWTVIHRKTSQKQIMREKEYIETYKKLLAEGKVEKEWVNRCISFHYFVREQI